MMKIQRKPRSIGLEELEKQVMILSSYPCDIRKAIDNYLSKHGIFLEASMETGQNEPILALIKANGGLTILPEMTVGNLNDDLKAITFKDKGFGRKLSLLTYTKTLKDLILQTL